MKLQMFTYVDGIDEAVAYYQKVFDATFGETFMRKDGGYELVELRLSRGVSFWLAERKGDSAIEGPVNTGNIMQMCIRYDKSDVAKLEKAYKMLKADALEVKWELMKAAWTSHTCDLIDKYGLRWCLMVG
ncbi:MAG: VOC family protein [Firmicutes bacterium]|nr:VOC family protein [Bacillota bacterium]